MNNLANNHNDNKPKKTIKIATNFPSSLNTLQSTKHLIEDGYILEVISEAELKEKYQITCNDALKEGLVDVSISNNYHTMNSYNDFSATDEETKLTMVQPFFHPRYGLYVHQKNPLKLQSVEDVKKHKNLRLLFAPFNDLFAAPCDFSRSLLLLNNLKLVKIDEEVIKAKGYNLNLDDIENIYNLDFVKTNNLFKVVELFADPTKYDLSINCPGFMRKNPDFKRIGTVSPEEQENNIVFSSYAIILASRKNNQDDEKVQAVKRFLKHEKVQKTMFEAGGPGKDYVMVQNPDKLKADILANFEQ
ncbi:MAG: D-methionine transport system, substrate-binding protein [Candidatus Phytoplasma pruni]|uniref:MetQ/NlpA family ABC transporter substrate-binding protein n=1 Tax=Poinsettia branch-inducing phytoplasma TaxID=138647 RepID=UPI00036916ED|nr:MetQ/NlpA family ABC transporter substrate-binding protein [Poinsettia branch-inducing phytoplasma]WEK82221.1 MAG: D-methionine transport system, substrate-binding protein [Candidatus Phytoplasma pruni]